MRISVIIPVLNEEKVIAPMIAVLKSLRVHEIIIVDGGSTDRTMGICRASGAAIVSSARGRARQMNAGAQAASGDVFLFLHADTQLPATALDDIGAALADPACVGGRFDVQLDSDRWLLRVVSGMISFRSRMTRVATGDQAIFVRREIFQEMGGYPDIPLMEDIALSRALKRRGKIACLRSRAITSARRWEVDGVWRTIFKMWALKSLYLLGVSPQSLKRYYGDAR